MATESGGKVLNRERAEKELNPASGLPGGGQLELRMEVSADHPIPIFAASPTAKSASTVAPPSRIGS